MSEQTTGSGAAPLPLPDSPNLDWLRKQAKRRLAELREGNPDAQLAEAQLAVARQYGFRSWRALKAHIDSLTLEGELFAAARNDAGRLRTLLDAHPDKLTIGAKPYGHTLLHAAAFAGNKTAVDLLLDRGLDANVREHGDNTYPMHWAAAAGHLEIVRRLANAGGDVVGSGDDHQLEVIGWATAWDGSDDAAHRAIADFLVSRGARHHIFSAIAFGLADEVRRIVAADATTLEAQMSHNESLQRPLHFAVRKNLPDMVALLLELGADPLARDDGGYPPIFYAAQPGVDRRVIEVLAAGGTRDLLAALALGDFSTAQGLLGKQTKTVEHRGALHLMAKRGDARAVEWLLARGADPNAVWAHFDADVVPLHMAAWGGHVAVAQLLLAAGADPAIRDSKHDGDALGWAEHFQRPEIVALLQSRSQRS
ncbi:MAG: ankyrin repeat domain-containing protein [Gemmatimonadota bacterium]